jgi:hypothetical protein
MYKMDTWSGLPEHILVHVQDGVDAQIGKVGHDFLQTMRAMEGRLMKLLKIHFSN